MTEPQEEADRRQQIFDSAVAADVDTESALLKLERMVMARRKDPRAEARYEALRDQLADDLKENGPRYFVDENGEKQYAYAVAPEIVIADQGAIEAMVAAGELSQEEFERIYPRKLDKEALRRSIAKKRGGMTNAQVVAAVRFRPGTAFVRFERPEEDHEEYDG